MVPFVGRGRELSDEQWAVSRVYKGRNVVERFLNYLKQWRGLATRSDKYTHS